MLARKALQSFPIGDGIEYSRKGIYNSKNRHLAPKMAGPGLSSFRKLVMLFCVVSCHIKARYLWNPEQSNLGLIPKVVTKLWVVDRGT